MKSYVRDYLIAILENKDTNAIDQGWFGTVISEFTKESYTDAADFLEDYLKIEDVEFVSSVLSETFPSSGFNRRYNGAEMLFRIFNLDEDNMMKYADLLLRYNEEIGLPDGMEEKLGTYAILKDFRNKYREVENYDRYRDFNSDMIADIVNNAEYDVMNTDQVEVLASLVYANFSDKNHTFSQSTYPFTRMMNQIALNSDLDEDVMAAMERDSVGWYAEDIESQLDKVDMADYNIQRKKEERQYKRENVLTRELVDQLIKEYAGVLEISFSKGHYGLEDQTNDHIIVKHKLEDNKVVYEDNGRGNEFGDTSLNAAPLLKHLEENGYKELGELFAF